MLTPHRKRGILPPTGPLCGAVLALPAAVSVPSAQDAAPPPPAIPVPAVDGILDAFRTYPIVALSEGDHGSEQAHAFRLSLIRDPRFAAVVNDIVVEFGSALYQDVIDRFVRGENVPDADLRRVWQNTTQPHTVWDRPIYEEWYRAVRAVNASLPQSRQLRVVLGDPPIDWTKINTTDDLVKWIQERDTFPVSLIQREVLAKQRRGLLVYGSGHFWRRNPARNYEPENTIVGGLEATPGTMVFSVWTTERVVNLAGLQPSSVSWRPPALALLKGTLLGARDFTSFWPYGGDRVLVRDGKRIIVPREQWRTLRMEDQFDALLHLGPPWAITISRISPVLCLDVDYLRMRLARMPLMLGSQGMIDELRQDCGAR